MLSFRKVFFFILVKCLILRYYKLVEINVNISGNVLYRENWV